MILNTDREEDALEFISNELLCKTRASPLRSKGLGDSRRHAYRSNQRGYTRLPDAEWSKRSDKPRIVIGTMLHAILEPEDKYPAAGLWSTPLNFAGRAWPPSEAKPEEISVSWKTRFPLL